MNPSATVGLSYVHCQRFLEEGAIGMGAVGGGGGGAMNRMSLIRNKHAAATHTAERAGDPMDSPKKGTSSNQTFDSITRDLTAFV